MFQAQEGSHIDVKFKKCVLYGIIFVNLHTFTILVKSFILRLLPMLLCSCIILFWCIVHVHVMLTCFVSAVEQGSWLFLLLVFTHRPTTEAVS